MAEPSGTDRILALVDAAVPAAAVSVALHLGLFWLVAERPRRTDELAAELGIPAGRCRRWLELLRGLGLVEGGQDGWTASPEARSAILDTYGRDTWAMLSQEALERIAALADLAARLRAGLPTEQRRSYVELMTEDPARARRFSRMLFELHRPLAEKVADALDLRGVRRAIDLGGGSGVVSIALARRRPELSVTIVEIAPVCAAAAEIVHEAGLDDRIATFAADFTRDDLPDGADLVIECDVGVYTGELFRRVRDVLEPGGRFVIVDELAPAEGYRDVTRLAWEFERALRDPDAMPPTRPAILAMLARAGFEQVVERPLPPLRNVGGRMADLVVVEARAG